MKPHASTPSKLANFSPPPPHPMMTNGIEILNFLKRSYKIQRITPINFSELLMKLYITYLFNKC